MIKKIGLKNFRVFKDFQQFELKPITIITGTNSSGKSSLFKAIKLLRKNFERSSDNNPAKSFDKLVFQNEKHHLGGFSKVCTKNSESNELVFRTNYSSSLFGEAEVEITYEKDENSNYDNGRLKRYRIIVNDKIVLDTYYETLIDHLGLNKENNERYSNQENRQVGWFLDFKEDEWVKAIYDLRKIGLWQQKMLALINKLKQANWEPLEKKTKGILSEEEYDLLKDCIDKGISFDMNMSTRKDLLYFEESNFWKVYDKDKNLITFNNTADDILEKTYWRNSLFGLEFLNDLKFNEIHDFKNVNYNNIKESSRKKIYNTIQYLLSNKITNIDELLSVIKSIESRFFKNNILKNRMIEFMPYMVRLKKEPYSLVIDNSFSDIFSYRTVRSFIDKKDYIQNVFKDNDFLIKLIESDEETLIKHMEYVTSYFIKLIEDEMELSLKAFTSFNDFIFIDSDRADIQRLFFDNNNSQFGRILKDFQNLPKDFYEKRILFINKWLQNFEVADSLLLERDSEGIGVRPYLIIEGEKVLLADLGFGVNQLIPMIIRISSVMRNSYVFIEEPESNLHPAFQSKMAEMFVDAYNKFGIHFSIETHSEYLIRRLQTLIADKNINIDPEKIKIYYLYNPKNIPKKEKQVYELKIREDGFMDNDFGKGFFDEATRLSIDLMKTQNLN